MCCKYGILNAPLFFTHNFYDASKNRQQQSAIRLVSDPMRNYADLPSLKCLQVFEQIARTGNVVRAAETLGITASAASHQLAKLEKSLGCQLFARSASGVQLNAKGEAYLREVGVHLQGLLKAAEELKNGPETRKIHIHSSPSFGYLWLLPRLGAFQLRYPDIEVSLACSYEEINFSRDQIDIAIRHGHPSWEGYDISSVRNENLAVMASPAYLKEHPVSSPADLVSHRLILSETPLFRWPEWFKAHQIEKSANSWCLRFDRSYMSLEAAAMGHGVVLESELLAERFLNSSQLVKVLDKKYSHSVCAHHIVTPVGYVHHPKVKSFIHWLNEELTRT